MSSDSEDQQLQRQAEQVPTTLQPQHSQSGQQRKKKLRKRAVVSDEDEDEGGYSQSVMPQGAGALKDEETPDRHQAAVQSDEDDQAAADAENSDDWENKDVDEIQAQIGKLEAKIKRQDKGKQKKDAKVVKEAAKIDKKAAGGMGGSVLPVKGLVKSGKRRKGTEMLGEDKKNAAMALRREMQEAANDDNQQNARKKPALNKLYKLDYVTKELRRIQIQEEFLDQGGCEQLAAWLYPLPDGTFPNVRIVQEILEVVDTLHIDASMLENQGKTLARTVKAYSRNRANMPQVQNLAKQIVDKWNRLIFGISTNYYRQVEDENGKEITIACEDDKYRRYKDKLDEMRLAHDARPNVNKIHRGDKGIIMPRTNAFDFVEKPSHRLDRERGSELGRGQSAGHEKIKKVMNGVKRQSKTSLVNRKMETVKFNQ